MYQAVGDNKDKLAQLLDETAIRLLDMKRTVESGVPNAAEKAMENKIVYPIVRVNPFGLLRAMNNLQVYYTLGSPIQISLRISTLSWRTSFWSFAKSPHSTLIGGGLPSPWAPSMAIFFDDCAAFLDSKFSSKLFICICISNPTAPTTRS